MRIVIPISSADADLADSFASALQHFGKSEGFSCLVVAKPTDQPHAEKLVGLLEGLFDSVSTHIFPSDGPTGWPKGPGHYWASTIRHMISIQNSEPWLWMELDCTPLCEGWAMKLLTEYNLSQKPFMGVIEPTLKTDAEGQIVKDGEHMVGAGVYPPVVANYSLLWGYASQMDQPFDILCQWEILPHTHNTKLIQHAFRTSNYEVTKEGIKGTNDPALPKGVDFDRVLSSEAVLHHGCQDGSLFKVLTEKDTKSSVKPPETKVDIVDDKPPQDTLKRRVATIREQGIQ
jgi:hypothetical protein